MLNSMLKILACGSLTLALLTGSVAAQKPAVIKHALAQSAQVVAEQSFQSVSLGRETHYSILLPKGYANSNRRYPVLYLLHGLYGNDRNWIARTDLAHYAESLGLIIVMPDGGDSWYTNSATNPQDNYEDYIAKDIVSEIDAKYRTIPIREDRFVAGLSMGGYAAMKLALKYPQQYSLAASLSGAFDAPTDLDQTDEYRAKLLEVFGPSGSQTRAENNVYLLLDNSDATKLPYLFLSCGTGDQFLVANRDFVSLLQKRKADYEYHEMPGAHEWTYWNTHIQDLLALVADRIQRNQMVLAIHRTKASGSISAQTVGK